MTIFLREYTLVVYVVNIRITFYAATCGKSNMVTCSFRCNQVCHAWRTATYQCAHSSDDQCVDTCGEECVSCPINYILKDPKTCVRPADCLCMLPDGSSLGPGQVRNDREACIRYYCWNNVLTDEVLVGCTPSLGGISAGAAGAGAGAHGGLIGGHPSGDTLGSGIGSVGAGILIGGTGFSTITEEGRGSSGAVGIDAGSKSAAGAAADAATKAQSEMTAVQEDNGIVTKHFAMGSNTGFADAAAKFDGKTGYTADEVGAIEAHGATAIAADGTASLFHDAAVVAHTTSTGDSGSSGIGFGSGNEQAAAAQAAAETAAALTAAIVQEGALCVDEGGIERKFGDSWEYLHDSCKTCTCHSTGDVRCLEKVCDPYPSCPEGHYVVEEQGDACCLTYRIVENECDTSLCEFTAPTCMFSETLVIHAIDNCCSSYECVCNPASCPDLGDPACPEGSIRVIVDPEQCCQVGKCVNIAQSKVGAGSGVGVLHQGAGFSTSTFSKSDDEALVNAATDSILESVGLAHAANDQDMGAMVKGGKSRGKQSKTSFHPGQTVLGADAAAGVGHGQSYLGGYMGAPYGQDVVAAADTGIVVKGGIYESITKSNNDEESALFLDNNVEQAAIGKGVAQGVSDSGVYIDGKDYGDDVTKTMFTPGNVILGAGALADSAGYGGYMGMPRHHYGGGEAYGAAKQGIAIGGGSFITETYEDGASDGVVKAGMGSDNLAAGQGLAQGAQGSDALVAGGKKGGKVSKTVFQPGQTVLGAGAAAGAGHELAYPYGYFGGKHGAAGHAAADSGIVIQGGAYETITMSDDDSAQDVAFGQGLAQGAQVSDALVAGGKKGGRKSKTFFQPGQTVLGAGAAAGAALGHGNFGGFYGAPIASSAGSDAKSSTLIGGGKMLSESSSGTKSGTDVLLQQATGAHAKGGAAVGSASDLLLQVAEESSLCLDESGKERRYGECWKKNNDPCELCTCYDMNDVRCQIQQCDPYPEPVEGKEVVEELTDECCSTFRYIDVDCVQKSCEFQPLICAPFERSVSYAIDQCCYTYECVCDQLKCPMLGHPSCPEGSVRVVLEQDACCPVGKCVFMDSHAAANAKQISNVAGGLFSTETHSSDGHGSDTALKTTGSQGAVAGAIGKSGAAAGVGIADKSGKGSTSVSSFIPGQTMIGSSALGDASSNFLPHPHHMYGGKGAFDSAASSGVVGLTDSGMFSQSKDAFGGSGSELGLSSDQASVAKGSGQAASKNGLSIVSEVDACIDNSGKGRALGEQWCDLNDQCTVYTCTDFGTFEPKVRVCDEAPLPKSGYIIKEETGDPCCVTYRLVKQTCEDLECQFTAPVCDINQKLISYPIDKCCSTYECVCNPESCGYIGDVICPDGSTRVVLEPHACCPVGKCVMGGSSIGGAQAAAGLQIIPGLLSTEAGTSKADKKDVAFGSQLTGAAVGQAAAASSDDTAIQVYDGSKDGSHSVTSFSAGNVAFGGLATGSGLGLGHGFGEPHFMPGMSSGAAEAGAKSDIYHGEDEFSSIDQDSKVHQAVVSLAQNANSGAEGAATGQTHTSIDIAEELSVCLDESGIGRCYGESWYKFGDACNLCTCTKSNDIECLPRSCDEYPVAPIGYVVVEEKADDCCYTYRLVKEECDITKCAESPPICNYYEDLIHYDIDGCCSSYECECNPSKCPNLKTEPCPFNYHRIVIDQDSCCSVGKCVQMADQLAAGQGSARAADSDIYVGDKDYGGDVSKTMFVPGSIALGAGALGKAMGQGHHYGGPGPYYGGAEGYGAAKQGIVIDGGSFITETYDDGASDGVVKAGMGSDNLAAGQGLAQGAQAADALVAGGKKDGKVSKTVFQPGQTVLGAGAAAGAGHEQAYPYEYFGGKHGAAGHAAADSGIVIQGGAYETITMSDDDSAQDVAFGSKADQLAAGQGLAQGAADSDIYVGDKDYGGDVSKTMFVPGSIALGAGALGKAMGQGHHYGGPGPYYGGAEGYGAAKQGIVINGGSFITETYDDGASDGVVKAGMRSDNLAAGQGLAQGAQAADALVAGGKKGGKVSKTVFQPGQTVLGAGAAAGAGHEQAYPYGYFGGKHGAAGHAAADSGIVIQGGAYETITMSDDDSAQDVAFGSKADQLAAGQGLAQGAADSDIYVGDKDYGGDVSKTMFVPGSIALGAGALGKAMGQGHHYGGPGPYYGGAEGYGAAKQGIVIDGGSFITETYDDGASDGVVKAGMGSDNGCRPRPRQGAQGSDAVVAGGKKGGKMSKTVFQPGQTVLGAGVGAGSAYDHAYPHGYFGGMHGAAGHAAADSGIVIQGGAYETITMSDDDSAQDLAFGSKADQLAAIFGKAASSSKSGLSTKPKASEGGYSKNQFSLGGLSIGAGVIGGGQSMFDGFSPFTGYHGQAMSSGVADTGLLLGGDSFKSLIADDSSSSSDTAFGSKSASAAKGKALGGTGNALSFISEASICIDSSGRERCFGDSWTDFSDECSSCTCTDVGKISCSVKECPAKPLEKEGFRIVESSKDACCINYMQVPTECDTSSCPYAVPTCQIYEELATYSLDDCCSTYECKCNPSLCPTLGSPPCPAGCVRIVMDSDECCPVGKCVKSGETDLFAGMEKHINMEPQGLLHSIQTEDDKDASVILSSNIGSAAQGSAASGANSLSALKIITEAPMCIDYQGKERNYADTWFQHSETCQLCSCADNADVRCETRNCDPYPVAPEGFVIVEEKADECCYNYRVVAAECEVLNCPYKATICEYYEDLVTYPIDECCCTYECKCNTAKCSKLGNPTCPHGTERMVIEDDACCPVGKCVEIKLEMEAQAVSNAGYAANAMLHKIEETGDEENRFGLNNYLGNNALTNVYGESTQGSDALVAGGKKGGKVSKTVFQPGQTVLGAGAAAGAGHETAYPYGYFGGKHGAAGHAAADSGIVIQGLRRRCEQDHVRSWIHCTRRWSTRKAMGQGHHYGGPGPYYGGAEGYGAAKQGIVIDGGSFITETYDDGASDGVVKAGIGSDNLAAGQGLAQGSQAADAIVAGGKKGGKVSKTVFQPGQTVLGAGAAAGAGHETAYPYGYFGGKHGAAGHAAADSGIVIQGGPYETITMSDDDSAQDVAFGSKADQLAAGQGLAQGAADSDIYVGDKDYGGDVSKTMFVPGSIALGAGALGKAMGQGHHYGGPGPYYGGAEGYGAAKQGIVIDGGSFITETYDDGASDGVVKAGMGSDNLAAGQGLAQGAQAADALVAGGKKGGKVSKTVFQPGQTVLGAGAAAGAGHEQTLFGGLFDGNFVGAGSSSSDAGIFHTGSSVFSGEQLSSLFDHDMHLSSDSNGQAVAASVATGSNANDIGAIAESPLCLDELGFERSYGETWYRKGDPCVLCTCHSLSDVRCKTRECDAYPLCPTGYKVISEQADDCCYSYRIVNADCDSSTCASSPKTCEFYEDLQFYPTDTDRCCGTYDCACNPMKCPDLGNLKCPFGSTSSVIDTKSCCGVAKCIRSETAVSGSAATSLLFGGGLFSNTMFGGNSDNDNGLMVGVGGSSKALGEAGAGSSSNTGLASKQASGGKTSELTSFTGGNVALLSDSSALATSLSSLAPGSDYNAYAAGRYNALAETYAKALASSETGSIDGCCTGLTDASACPSTCPKDKVCDGTSCVYPRDCPCFRNSVRRPTGAVWKEDNGCSNCICMGGDVQCAPESCEVTSCPSGQKLAFAHPEDCCAVCMDDDSSCTDTSGNLHNVGESWADETNSCQSCYCTTEGVKCEAEPCPVIEKPTCSDGQMLVTKESGCCPEYDCVCDTAMCTSTMPVCEEHYSAVIVNPTDCCPIYECVCRSETCPVAPACAFGERRERTNDDTACCGEYKCERIGCTDDSGNFHEVHSTWTMSTDACQQCSCLGDRNLACKARECSDIAKPMCPGGVEPSVVFDIDGCCPTYVCDFVCRGYAGSSRIHTFDGYSYARSCPCAHVLAKDSFGVDFQVSVKRGYCAGSICTKALLFSDSLSGEVYEMEIDAKTPMTSSNFVVEVTGMTQTITAKSTGVKVVFDQASDAWSIHVPAKFSGQTEGLCGLADGEISNDLWMGSYSVASVSTSVSASSQDVGTFFNHWLDKNIAGGSQVGANGEAGVSSCLSDALPETGLIAGGGSALVRSYCEHVFALPTFSSLSSFVDAGEYVDTCVRATAGLPVMKIGVAVSGEWPGCSVFAAYASAAARAGKCIEWRTSDFCAYSGCSSGSEYIGCGSSVTKTCDNFKTFDGLPVTYNTEGCFCSSGKVLLDGECVDTSVCPVCSDESGYGRRAGEQWYYAGEPCIVAICQPDSSVVQSQVNCPAAPLCGPNENLAKVSDESLCCTAYVCLPDNHESKCVGLTCPPIIRPRCAVGEQWKATPSGPSDCCLTYTCECNSDSCPVTSVPLCEEGEELEVIGTDDCCPSATCVCKIETCAPKPDCSEAGHTLRVVDEGRCCSTYECVCDRDSCAVAEIPTCLGGETAVVVNAGECCPVYACECDKSQCRPCTDDCAAGFTRELVSEPGACCEVYECKCDVTQCPVTRVTPCSTLAGYRLVTTGKEIRAPGLPECCASEFEEICVCDVGSCPVSTVTCESYERKYQTNPGECCPTYACECDNTQCERGVMSCPSKQHLIEKVINSCCSISVCECDVCEPAEPCKDGWMATDTFDECSCTIRTCVPPTECVYLGETHAPGVTWMEDICTECSCSSTPNSLGEFESTCSAIKCGSCSSGYTYVPVAGQCCGDCVQTVCHNEGKQFAPGQTWTPSDDQCTTCECMIDPISNEVYSQCSAPACAPLDPLCAPENVMTTEDGCCTYCKTRNLPENKCRPVSDFFEEIEHDGCRSADKVNVTMCEGQCTSASVFSSSTGGFEKQCSCCSTMKTEKRTVDLTCPDMSTKVYVYEVALECACHATACGSEPLI
ncbi:uncharacterized protein LOC445660 [Ciona intestinalis]